MSQHKFASNVVEKCLEYCDPTSRELLISEVIGKNEGNDNLLVSQSRFRWKDFIVIVLDLILYTV